MMRLPFFNSSPVQCSVGQSAPAKGQKHAHVDGVVSITQLHAMGLEEPDVAVPAGDAKAVFFYEPSRQEYCLVFESILFDRLS